MINHFENLSIDPNELPSLAGIDFKPIDPNYLKVSLISSALFFLILIGGSIAIIEFSDIEEKTNGYLISMSAIIILAAVSVILTILGFKKKQYALRQRDIIYTKGLIWSVRTTVPFNRIQHAELKQGPIERLYKINSLKLYTAGGQSSDLVIPGLPDKDALSIKDFVLKKTEEDGANQS
ncbi:PH domain-containing protein [Roseivirga sp.]|uniref:PH domain-containing protein n=1 Tax=Roseivirga sp. TaxID=1964215 RepID=UPI002B279A34|nr:PH domain-containing protein [Roseivirga sp.]